jgi:hypothetical protein
MGSNRKAAAGLVVANENFLFKMKKREMMHRLIIIIKELTKNKEKKRKSDIE